MESNLKSQSETLKMDEDRVEAEDTACAIVRV